MRTLFILVLLSLVLLSRAQTAPDNSTTNNTSPGVTPPEPIPQNDTHLDTNSSTPLNNTEEEIPTEQEDDGFYNLNEVVTVRAKAVVVGSILGALVCFFALFTNLPRLRIACLHLRASCCPRKNARNEELVIDSKTQFEQTTEKSLFRLNTIIKKKYNNNKVAIDDLTTLSNLRDNSSKSASSKMFLSYNAMKRVNDSLSQGHHERQDKESNNEWQFKRKRTEIELVAHRSIKQGVVDQFYKTYGMKEQNEESKADIEAQPLPEEHSESESKNNGPLELSPDNRYDEIPPYETSIMLNNQSRSVPFENPGNLARFTLKAKGIKEKLKQFGHMVDRFENQANNESDIEARSGAQVQDIIAAVQKHSEDIQMDIDELEEIENEISKLPQITQSEKTLQTRLKNNLKDLQVEHSQLKKQLRAQLKLYQSIYMNNKSQKSSSNSRLKNLSNEGDRLSKTLAMAQNIIEVGQNSSTSMYAQSERLKKTHKNLKKIQTSSLPGIDRLMGMVKRANLKNTVIIAFVIALCFCLILYSKGFTMIGGSTTVTPEESANVNQNQ